MFNGKQICHKYTRVQNLVKTHFSWNVKIKYIPELSATETVDNKVDGWIKDQQKLGDKTKDYHPDWETSQTCAPG